MATQTSNGKSAKTKVKSAANGKRTTKAKGPTAKAATADRNPIQSVAQTAVDLPVGAVLSVTDRVSDLVEPWTGRKAAEKQIKAYRNQLRKSLKRT
ncbi:MAG: hypothetical protein WB507_07275, partial [Solirubrobacterales bacterium]